MTEEKKKIQKKKTGKKSPVVAKPKMKPRGGSNFMEGVGKVSVKPGDNTKYASLLMEVNSWGDIDVSSVPALEDRMGKYLQFCFDNDLKIGNQMCYFALGITKDDVYNWEHGRTLGQEHSEFIKKVRKLCSGNRELLLQDGKVNPILGIFWQKNYDGLKDVQDLVLTPNNLIGDIQDEGEIAKRYVQSVTTMIGGDE